MGSYVEGHLIAGEYIVYRAFFHWVIYLSLKSFLTLGLYPWIQSLSSEFVITNKRIIMKTGLIRRQTFEINLSRVESVEVRQTVMGRIFNYGDIIIIGTGGSRGTFSCLADPITFRLTFQQLI